MKEADENVAENGKHRRRKNEQDRIRMSRMVEGEREREREEASDRKKEGARKKKDESYEDGRYRWKRVKLFCSERRTKQKAYGYHCTDSLGYNTRAVRGGLASFLLSSS